jgi:hypothetical protein
LGDDGQQNQFLQIVIGQFNELIELDLSQSWVDDSGLASIVPQLSQLTTLNLSQAQNLTDGALTEIQKSLPKLTDLNLKQSKKISLQGVAQLKSSVPNLVVIY